MKSEREAQQSPFNEDKAEGNLKALIAYVDEAKKAAGNFYITGRPLPDVVRDMAEAIQRADNEIERLANLYQQTVVERDQFAKLMGTMKAERDVLAKENKELRKAPRSEGDECDEATFKYEALLEKIACAVGVHEWESSTSNYGGGRVCHRCGKSNLEWVKR